jgi:glutamate synthase (NADPH/NADH) large chain
VNPDAIRSDELRLLKPAGEQVIELRDLISRHALETGSRFALRLLEDFGNEIENFTVVMPSDFASVTQILQAARNQGVDTDGAEVWEQILEATNG